MLSPLWCPLLDLFLIEIAQILLAYEIIVIVHFEAVGVAKNVISIVRVGISARLSLAVERSVRLFETRSLRVDWDLNNHLVDALLATESLARDLTIIDVGQSAHAVLIFSDLSHIASFSVDVALGRQIVFK